MAKLAIAKTADDDMIDAIINDYNDVIDGSCSLPGR
jgi:hypothetical protein